MTETRTRPTRPADSAEPTRPVRWKRHVAGRYYSDPAGLSVSRICDRRDGCNPWAVTANAGQWEGFPTLAAAKEFAESLAEAPTN